MNEIEKAIQAINDFNSYKISKYELASHFKTILSALEQQLNDRWIPANEQLPEDGKKLLVSIGNEVYRATRHEGWWYAYYPQGQKLVSHVDA